MTTLLAYMSRLSLSSRTLVNFAFTLLLLAVVAIPVSLTVPIKNSDFPVYYQNAQLIRAGKGPEIWRHDLVSISSGPGLNEPPLVMWALAPVAWLPFPAAKFVFDCTMAVLIAISALVLARTARLSQRGTLLLLGLMAASGPIFEILKVSKPSPLLFCGVAFCLACLQKGEETKAGAWIALCMVKPQEVLPFLAFMAGGMRKRFLLGLAAAGLVLVALAFLVFGVEGFTNYLNRLAYIEGHPYFVMTDNQSILTGQLLRLGVPPATAMRLGNTVYGLGLLGLFIFGLMTRTSAQWWIKGTVVAFVSMACFFPYMFAYDLVIVIPGICFLIQMLAKQRGKLLLGGALLSVGTYLNPIYIFIHYYLPFRIDLHFCALVVCSLVSIAAVAQFDDRMSALPETRA